MERLKYILLIGVAVCSVAATPLYSTKVNEALKVMLNVEGKFTSLDFIPIHKRESLQFHL